MKFFKILKGKNKRKILIFLALVTIFLVIANLGFPSIKLSFLTKIVFADDGGSSGGGSDGGSSGGGSDGGSSGGGTDGGSSGGGDYGGGEWGDGRTVGITVDIKGNGSDGPINLLYKNNVTLFWTSENAAFCNASGDWSGSKSISGTQTMQLNTVKTYTFTIACINGSGSQTASDFVQVVVSPTLPVVVTKPVIATY